MRQMQCRVFSLVLILLTSPACTTTNRLKTLSLMTLGAVSGGAYGATRDEEKPKNALLFGSVAASLLSLTGLLIFNDPRADRAVSAETEELRKENLLLRDQLAPKLQTQGSSSLESPLPKSARRLIKPGGWRLYKLDRWIPDEANENTWYRQTEMFELIPPVPTSN